MMKPGWRAWESYVAEVLGCDPTLASGNQWFDPGDATTRGRHSPFPLYVEAKYSEKKTFVLNLRQIRQAHHRAVEMGKRFVMPIRLWPKASRTEIVGPADYALIPLNDLAELLQMAQEKP